MEKQQPRPLSVPGFAALFSLNEFRNAVNVLSTPQILTSDNKEAEIVVGENVPFIARGSGTLPLPIRSSTLSIGRMWASP